MKVWPIVAALAALLAAPVHAKPTEAEFAAAKAAETRGNLMFDYDQAAWHATDAFMDEVSKSGRDLDRLAKEEGLAGYIVEPGETGALIATFFGRKGDALHAVARYTVKGSTVTGGGFVKAGDDPALSPLAQRMIAARDVAFDAGAQGDHGLCSRETPNTLALPPDENGVISAYILTATRTTGIYPAGGHFRFDVGPDGKLVGERRFMKGCFTVDYRQQDGKTPAGVFLTHLLDPQPTEIHVFVSRNIPIGLYVGTEANNAVWEVEKGHIKYVSDVQLVPTIPN